VHREDLAQVTSLAPGPLSTGTLYEAEFRVLHQDGKYRWAWDRSLFDTDDDGRPLRAIGVVQDVTARKELESQMNSAQRMETVGALAAGLAHDVNNYLTTILGNVEFALMNLDAEQHPELSDARDAAVGCAELVRKLLAFARPQQAQRERLEPVALLGDTVRMLQRLAGQEVVLSATATDDCGLFEADRVQIQQLLMNLVANAREAMGGKGAIQIGASGQWRERDGQGRSFVCIEVTDSGPGIPAEVRHRIFEPYFTTRRFGEGTGLGLSIVHGIVTSHAGFVEVESPAGAGATFRAYFPAIDS
jgi:signal transduction histidine kinase